MDDLPKGTTGEITFFTRDQWQARETKETNFQKLPFPYVVVHHSYIPPACYNKEQCCLALKHMQNFHMDDHDWPDIGYHFLIGSDGLIYEGRGWKILGGHAYNFNQISLGICLIGDWCNTIPPPNQIEATKALIAAGVQQGYISTNYKLIGHRQVRETECPGDALFEYIQTWDHYSAHPASADDLLDIKEMPDSIRNRLIIESLKNKT